MNISASGLVLGPLQYYWYTYLDKILSTRSTKVIMKKILLDQLIGATVYNAIFIYIVTLFEGKSLKECFKELNDKFLYIYAV